MKGDFTRNTFDRSKRFSQVLMQQGRVQLDADWNEQAAIMRDCVRSVVADLVGPACAVGDGFLPAIFPDGTDFTIKAGRFYVDGIACDNPMDLTYKTQPGFPFDGSAVAPWGDGQLFLVYLDAWEQLVTYVEHNAIREVALGGADTAVRAQVAWQVKLLALNGTVLPSYADANQLLQDSRRAQETQLRAWAKQETADGPCAIHPDAAFRGPENQLYRVEIHDPGKVQATLDAVSGASFKWSRENGSVVFPVLALAPGAGQVTATLAHLGRDERLGLVVGDWVEVIDESYVLQNRHDPLLQVSAIDLQESSVTLTGSTSVLPSDQHYILLRRWDQRHDVDKNGVVPIQEADDPAGAAFILEDGVTIQFHPHGDYRSGDYWLIPARTVSGDVEWPRVPGAGNAATPVFLPPGGVDHHYAPLGVLNKQSGAWDIAARRCTLQKTLSTCPP